MLRRLFNEDGGLAAGEIEDVVSIFVGSAAWGLHETFGLK